MSRSDYRRVGLIGPKVVHMVTPLELCIADEVLAIVAAKHLRHNEIQAATGINERTWRRYFVEQSRAVPAVVLIEVGDAIGVPAEQIIAAARVRMAAADPVEMELRAGLTPAGRRELEQARREIRGDAVDPQGRANPDKDDGADVVAIGRSASA